MEFHYFSPLIFKPPPHLRSGGKVAESPRRGRNVEELSSHPTLFPSRGEGIWISFTPHPFPLPIRRGEGCRVVGV